MEDTSDDDFLDNMTHRTELSDNIDRDVLGISEYDGEEAEQNWDHSERSSQIPSVPVGRILSVFMLLCGLVGLWLYGGLAKIVNPLILAANNPSYVGVLTDPLRLGLLALVCFVPVMLWRKRRKQETSYLYP